MVFIPRRKVATVDVKPQVSKAVLKFSRRHSPVHINLHHSAGVSHL